MLALRFRVLFVGLMMSFVSLFGGSGAQAQTTTTFDTCHPHCGDDMSIPKVTLAPLSKASTSTIVTALNDTTRGCNDMLVFPPKKEFGKELYQIDCLRLHYKKIADSIPENGDYKGVKAALEDASRKLDRIVRQNQDLTQPVVQIHERGKPDATIVDGGLRPIKKERLAVARAAAQKVIEDTALIILRSGEIPTRRNVHYTSISVAVSTNLVVLRSA